MCAFIMERGNLLLIENRLGNQQKENYKMVPLNGHKKNASYLQNELQTLFDEKGWILIYTPPGKPEWQAIKTVWGMAKNHVRKNYNHAEQTYTKMRHDLVKGFYGNKKNSYPGVTKKNC